MALQTAPPSDQPEARSGTDVQQQSGSSRADKGGHVSLGEHGHRVVEIYFYNFPIIEVGVAIW